MILKVQIVYGISGVYATMNTSTKEGFIIHPTDTGAVSYNIRWFIEDGMQVSFGYVNEDPTSYNLPSSLLRKIDQMMTDEYRRSLEELIVE